MFKILINIEVLKDSRASEYFFKGKIVDRTKIIRNIIECIVK